MKKQLVSLILVIFMINMVLGFSVCIDKDAPTWPPDSSLELRVVNDNDVKVTWDNAKDKPNCSGIDYYTIFRSEGGGNLEFIGNSTSTTYLDEELDYGTYEYMIHAYDKVGHNESNVSISNSITLEESSDEENGGEGTTPSTISSTSTTSVWECGEWSECENGTQTRECRDLLEYKDEKTETKDCSLDFTKLSDERTAEGNETNETEDTEEGLESENTGINSFITGFATALLGEENQGKTLGYSAVVIAVLALGVIFIRKQKSPKSNLKLKKK